MHKELATALVSNLENLDSTKTYSGAEVFDAVVRSALERVPFSVFSNGGNEDYFIDFLARELHKSQAQVKGKDKKLRNQRIQLRHFQEKLAAMKTWRGICRTIGQKLGVCR